MYKIIGISTAITLVIAAFILMNPEGGCGYSAKGNEVVGQVKKVVEHTPIICGDYATVDISLGVLRNGNGSMSREDMVLRVDGVAARAFLKEAAETGQPIKVMYNIQRLVICGPDHILTYAELLNDQP
jgi:hypothetical protein